MTTAVAARTVRPGHTGAARPGGPVRLLLPPMAEAHTEEPRAAVLAVPVRARSVRSPVEDAGPAHHPTEVEPTPPLPDARATAGPLALAAQEALTGSRPLAQLGRWVTPELYGHLAGLLPTRRRTGPTRRARVLSVRAAEPRDGAVETTVVLHDGERVRAAAIRLAEHRGRWRATDMHIG